MERSMSHEESTIKSSYLFKLLSTYTDPTRLKVRK